MIASIARSTTSLEKTYTLDYGERSCIRQINVKVTVDSSYFVRALIFCFEEFEFVCYGRNTKVNEERMESRSRASPEQFAALIEFMESHGDITRPQQGPQGRIKADRLWQEVVELLNSIGGGVIKPLDKWKKVWADWKTKTKKKALAIRCEASGTGGGPSSRQTLTATEERVLGIMGLNAVTGLPGIEERGFDAPPSERDHTPPPHDRPLTTDSMYVCPSQSQVTATDELIIYQINPSDSIQGTIAYTAPPSLPPPSGEQPPSPVLTLPPRTASAPMPSATSPVASTSRGVPQRQRNRVSPPPVTSPVASTSRGAPQRQRHRASPPLATSPIASTRRGAPQRQRHLASPPPATSPATSTPLRRGLLRARTRRIQTPFERATGEFVAVEHRRLQLEADREKKFHEREMERLRLESRRIEMQENQNVVLSRLAGALENLIDILPQLRQSSLPSTDIIP